MPRVAAGTVVAKNHLSFARVLARSFKAHHPGVPFFVLLADEVDGCFNPAREPFTLLTLRDVEIPSVERFRFHYLPPALSRAATPWLLTHLLNQGFTRVLFVKPDSHVLGSHAPVLDRLKRHAIVLTPHLLEPLEGASRISRELATLRAGTFDAGLIGVADRPPGRAFLRWWQTRLHRHCLQETAGGMHFEQRWLDLVPVFFETTCVLRETRYNVGPWNIPERRVEVDAGTVLVNGEPCALFRFTGYDPAEPHVPTKLDHRVTWESLGPARSVFKRYQALLEHDGVRETTRWPYAYGTFDNGIPVPELARRLYLDLGAGVDTFGDPLVSSPPHSFFRWLNQPVDGVTEPARAVTRLWDAVYRRRPDVQRVFPDVLGADREAFLVWTAQHGVHEHGVAGGFVAGWDVRKPDPC